MKDLGISLVIGMFEGKGTYFLDIASTRCAEQGRFLFCFPEQISYCVKSQPNNLEKNIHEVSNQMFNYHRKYKGECFEILFCSHNSHYLYLYIPIGFCSREANMEFDKLYTEWETRAASMVSAFK